MQDFKRTIRVSGHWFLMILVMALILTSSCKKKENIIQNVTYDNVIYDLDTTNLYSSNVEKTKQKSSSQYNSILYADLFHKSISTKKLTDLDQLRLSIGDKTMANELILSDYVHEQDVDIPTNTEMRNDIDMFIDNTYIKFYLRKPTEYEKHYLREMIMSDPDLTPELIYTAFATSNEYSYY